MGSGLCIHHDPCPWLDFHFPRYPVSAANEGTLSLPDFYLMLWGPVVCSGGTVHEGPGPVIFGHIVGLLLTLVKGTQTCLGHLSISDR